MCHSVLFAPKFKALCNDLITLFKFPDTVVMGDLNCKRKEWNCTSENQNGKILLDFCLFHKIIISTPLNSTNIPTRGSASVLDIFLLQSYLNHSLPESICELSSDHDPVKIKLSFN